VILKRNGRRTPFDRDKLERSLGIALRKRPVQPDQVELLVSRIVRQLESLGETEIPSHIVGDFIMKALKSVDEVAYVRYASVYKDFRHTSDFAKFLGDEGFDETKSGQDCCARASPSSWPRRWTVASPRPRAKASGSPGPKPVCKATACARRMTPSWSAS